MEKEEQIRRYQNSTAESFASLSLGLWTVSLIGYLSSGISWMTYLLVIVGAMSALFGIYLVLPWNCKQKQVLRYLETKQIIKVVKSLVWLVVIAIFAVNLMQTGVVWLIVTGLITIIIAFIVFYVVLWRMNKDNRKLTFKRKVT